MSNEQHWQQVYTTKAIDAVSWYRPHLDRSLAFIDALGLDHDAPIIDIGAGASTLVDDLLARGFRDLAVNDLAEAALAQVRARLAASTTETRVHCRVGDITTLDLPAAHYALWHDRAVFHFLTTQEDREAYVKQVLRALKPGGHVIMATFGSNGPTQCSGLPVMRYAPDELHAEFGEAFTMLTHEEQMHHTPFGTDQQFIYCMCRKKTT